ncbi:hypothetical protein KI811_14855 [Geobacter hydrogenophilus]|uniref:PH domain-containing protein n=2 Tax=Geobacter hydrogenophilus TaxID=40983 RepID=A0A9W6LBX4_9BACT|nr:hypothetical protein [Geobacter hydrogenophilus]MBT0895091.1 hypothetical protein [Geobacter hydrogenophilus]GLI36916.1 hypothetical protein GHYDROH2_04170 [Geobacter hydrogenophilus]
MDDETKEFNTSTGLKVVLAALFLFSIILAFPPYTGRHATVLMLPIILPMFWYFLLITAYKVEVTGRGSVSFWSVTKRRKIAATDISEIRDGLIVIKIVTSTGAIRVTNLINNPESLTSELVKLNPHIVSKAYSR